MSATTIYRQLFGAALPDANASFLSNEDALLKLVSDSGVDVVVVVAGQPTKLLVDMKPEARKLIKLLKFDPANPRARNALKTYYPATIRASSYPNLLSADIPGAAVKAFLVTLRLQLAGSIERLRKFARSICRTFSTAAEGHPKWREVQLALPELPRGWLYYPPMQRELKTCIADSAEQAAGAGVYAAGEDSRSLQVNESAPLTLCSTACRCSGYLSVIDERFEPMQPSAATVESMMTPAMLDIYFTIDTWKSGATDA
jgi:hypothetical protein